MQETEAACRQSKRKSWLISCLYHIWTRNKVHDNESNATQKNIHTQVTQKKTNLNNLPTAYKHIG